VDDQIFNIHALKIILKCKCNINNEDLIDHAVNGEEAFEMIRNDVENINQSKRCTYNLIFMDCQMPIMDGYEATNKIRMYLYKMNIEQPIISAVTGHTEQSYIDRAIQAGMN